jgi:glycosyltransferase involved in cell wall biosynthesis
VGSGMRQDNLAIGRWLRAHNVEDCLILGGPQQNIPGVMAAIELHVLPSRHGEAFPNVVAEAMACETPCAVTDVGDSTTIVGDAGWVVPPRDPGRLAAAMGEAMDLWTDRPMWRLLRQHARERIMANYSIEVMVQRYRHVWSRASS